MERSERLDRVGDRALGDEALGDEAPGRPVVRCDGLQRRYGARVAVDGVSFEVASGETYGLLGPNGAGKTTTIKMICGLVTPDEGTVTIAGRPQGPSRTDTKALVGYVPQEVALYPDLTARENLRFFGRLQRRRGQRLDRRIDEVLELVDLADRADDRVEAFSGGMARRLNIAVALPHEPKVLILAEPTVGVDAQSRHAILAQIQELQRSGLAVLYTTHYMEEAQALCDRIGIMDAGRLVAEGTHRELVATVAERDRIVLAVRGDLDELSGRLGALDGIEGAVVADGHIQLIAADAASLLPTVIDQASAAGSPVTHVEIDEPDLEAVFLHLTGTSLRE